LNSILATGPNDSIGLGGITPHYTLFLFCGSQIPQMNPNMGGVPSFNLGSNPPASGWSNQPGGQASAQVSSYNPTSSVKILTNTFGMMNPPISSKFQHRGGQFHTLGNPQLGSNLAGEKFFNPQLNIPAGMMPNQPYMNHPGGGPYNTG
jgi:hypothetical protein